MSSSAPQIGPISQQYSAAATVPLIKSPSLWLPPPVEMPSDIHPLPEDITAYFVYPFTLEEHIVSLQPLPHVAIAQRRARNAAILHAREVEEEQRERAALHKVAPGYNPASVLVPLTASPASPGTLGTVDALGHARSTSTSSATMMSGQSGTVAVSSTSTDPMDELVRGLEEMESSRKA